MKYGIEFEFFVSKDGVIVPAYLATRNLDGDPFLGEIKTEPVDSIVDCIFELKKLIFLEQAVLQSSGFKMEVVAHHQFSPETFLAFRKDRSALYSKKLEVLEEFSIYQNGKTSKILKRGEVKASLQINLSYNQEIFFPVYNKVTIGEAFKYEETQRRKSYSSLFNYVDIISKLDTTFSSDIKSTNRTKGVYAIKSGEFGDRIEYRSLPNTINPEYLISVLK